MSVGKAVVLLCGNPRPGCFDSFVYCVGHFGEGDIQGACILQANPYGPTIQAATMLKFRSMVVRQSDDVSLVTSAGDARITWVGAILRRLKLMSCRNY